MKELCKLAEEKGFQCHTFSTRWTIDYYLERGKKFMVNKECNIILLAEIQYWLREIHNINCESMRALYSGNPQYVYLVLKDIKQTFKCDETMYNTYEEALKIGLQESLKLIPDVKVQNN